MICLSLMAIKYVNHIWFRSLQIYFKFCWEVPWGRYRHTSNLKISNEIFWLTSRRQTEFQFGVQIRYIDVYKSTRKILDCSSKALNVLLVDRFLFTRIRILCAAGSTHRWYSNLSLISGFQYNRRLNVPSVKIPST